jgi:hypothetical protein
MTEQPDEWIRERIGTFRNVTIHAADYSIVGILTPADAKIEPGDGGMTITVAGDHWLARHLTDTVDVCTDVVPVSTTVAGRRWHGRIESVAGGTRDGCRLNITRNRIDSLFDVDRWFEFNALGSARTSHEQPVPIWAGFIIEMLGALMTSQEHLNADVAQLVGSFGAIVALVQAQKAEIDSLKSAAPADLDFTALDDVTAKLAQVTSSVPSAPAAAPVPDPAATAPVTSEPVDLSTPVDPTPVVDTSTTDPILSTPIADEVAADVADHEDPAGA